VESDERRAWRRSTPADARRWLADARVPWWISGGWALELHCRTRIRSHGDLDVGCFRADLPGIRAALRTWATYAAHRGVLSPLAPSSRPGEEVNSLWCRPAGAPQWWLEIQLDRRDGADWVFRRLPEVRLPVEKLVLRAADGTPYLRPEVQLLYKAKATRGRDDEDFTAVLPGLDADARAWLRDSLARAEPGHAWLEPLERAG